MKRVFYFNFPRANDLLVKTAVKKNNLVLLNYILKKLKDKNIILIYFLRVM